MEAGVAELQKLHGTCLTIEIQFSTGTGIVLFFIISIWALKFT